MLVSGSWGHSVLQTPALVSFYKVILFAGFGMILVFMKANISKIKYEELHRKSFQIICKLQYISIFVTKYISTTLCVLGKYFGK